MMHLVVLEGPAPAPVAVPLPLCAAGAAVALRLRCLPGASGLHLVVRDGDAVRLRAEVPADGGESVAVHLDLDAGGAVHAWSPGRHVLLLPPDERFAPAPAIPAPAAVPALPALDLALVLDGTLRHLSRDEKGARVTAPLLAMAEVWEPHLERLLGLAAALAAACAARVAVLAFGDEAPPGVTAGDLLPAYRLFPEEPALAPFAAPAAGEPEPLLAELRAVPPTSGGDFVDALADALAACRRLRWRPEARKLLVIIGHSPGHSLQHPVPKGGDCRARRLDVDVEAMALHRAGVEIMTIFHEMPADSGTGDLTFQRELLDHARAQYRRLASLPAMAWTADRFDPLAAAQVILRRTEPLGRGATWGRLLAAVPAGETPPPAEPAGAVG